MCKVPLCLHFHTIQFTIIVRWFMMKEYQPTYMSCTSCSRCHVNRAVAETLLRLLIIIVGVLCIMNQQICAFCKRNKSRVIPFLPLHIGSKDETPACILDPVDERSIFRMT